MARTLQSAKYNVQGKRPAFHGAKRLSRMSKRKTKALMLVCLVLCVVVWFDKLCAARAARGATGVQVNSTQAPVQRRPTAQIGQEQFREGVC